jgi:carbon dioxide concentrating mechanism protein CcmO
MAVGLIETIGFPAMVGAADAMLKSADVTLSAYETTGAGLCTAIVRGTVANVAAALESGMAEAERIGELHAVMLIPRPLDDLERAMPLAECWIEELEPLRIPLALQQEQYQRQPLPPLEVSMAELPAASSQQQPLRAELELDYGHDDGHAVPPEPMPSAEPPGKSDMLD